MTPPGRWTPDAHRTGDDDELTTSQRFTDPERCHPDPTQRAKPTQSTTTSDHDAPAGTPPCASRPDRNPTRATH
jgi:hypothetical protein